MTDLEYDILDELYFITSWSSLADALGRSRSDQELRQAVEELVRQGLVRTYFPDADSEFTYQPMLFGEHYHQMLYLATKTGLMAHHGR